MVINLDQLAPCEGATSDEWPQGESSGSSWREVPLEIEPWEGRRDWSQTSHAQSLAREEMMVCRQAIRDEIILRREQCSL
jgi:hypothetical protein